MALEETIEKIDRLKKQLDQLSPMKEADKNRLWQKLRLEWNFNSNHLEGNTLNYGETELLLLYGGKTVGEHNIREYEEMKAHDVSIHIIRDWSEEKEREISEADIRQLNKVILKEPYWKDARTFEGQPTQKLIKVGEYKETPNSVLLPTGETFHFTSPEETPAMMEELINWFRSEKKFHPVIFAAEFHFRFIRVHPFDDGNGRVARLLVNYILMKNGFPPMIVKSADKENYFTALRKGDAGNRNAFHQYMVEQILWSLGISIKAAKGESIEEPDDLDKEIHLLNKELKDKNVLSQKKDADTIVFAVDQNIFPLYQILEEKFEKLKGNFFDWNRRITFTVEGAPGEFQIGSTLNELSILKDNFLKNQIHEQDKLPNYLSYSYNLNGLKPSIRAHAYSVRIDVYFNQYNYMIQSQVTSVQQLNVAYGKKLSKEELLAIVTPVVKKLVDDIKQAI